MPDLPSFDSLFGIARAEILQRNARITVDAVDRPGADANAFVAADAAVGDEVIGQLALVQASLFLDSATAGDLDTLVFDRYGLLRKQAAPAIGEVQFTTTTPAGSAFTIPVGTTLQTSDGIKFLTTAQTTYPMGSSGPVTVPVRSILAGLDQQARIGTITSIVSVLAGSPSDLAVTNATATAGAADAESDASLRQRARQFFATARRGTLDAIQNGALAVPGVDAAQAFELLDRFGRPAGFVQLVIADAFTATLVDQNTNPPSYQTQSQLLSANVFSALTDTRAYGIFIDVIVGQVVIVPIRLALSFTAGVDTDTVTTNAKAACVNVVNALQPGQPLTIAMLVSALRTVQGLIVTGNEIQSPEGTVVPALLQVLRTQLNFVTIAGA